MLTFELLLQKFSLFGFICFLFVLLMGLYRLKRMSRLPLIVFLIVLLAVPGIAGLLWLFAALRWQFGGGGLVNGFIKINVHLDSNISRT